MARSIFILKEGNSPIPTLVYLFSRIGGKRFKYSTGQKVLPAQWDNTTFRVKSSGLKGQDLESAKSINNVLSNYERAFMQVSDALVLSNQPETVSLIKTGLEKRLGKEPKSRLDYLNIGDTFTDYTIYQIHNGPVKDGTKKVYNELLNHINGYNKNRKLEFQSIDLRFYAGFTHYLTSRGLSVNTIGKYIRTLKSLVSSAFDKGLHTQLDFKKQSFRAVTEETVKIYLSENEIQQILKLKNLSETHERIRDVFIIACRTALRYSDIENLKPENFINNSTLIKSHTIKTGAEVVIPLHPDVRMIWEKYNHIMPKVDVNQVFNRNLKEIGEAAKINTPTPIQSTKGGKLVRTTVPKYELITTHTGRRTFATLAYLAGVPTIAIMKITGHKTEAAFMRYIKITAEENANELIKHPFFMPKLRAVR